MIERRDKEPDDFKTGDIVVAVGGSFESSSGTVVGRDGKNILVELPIFGRVPFNPAELRHKESDNIDKRPTF
jgi:transcription antitermination factor NusG